jgi:uncharacterized protein (TIGR02266 family)
MSASGEEKRLHPRVPFVLRVEYGDGVRYGDATENLSSGGLFVQTDREFTIGEQVPLSLSFPGLMDPVEIIGRVAWIRRPRGDDRAGVGIRVDRDADKQKLDSLVNVSSTESRSVDLASLPPGGFRVLIVEDNPHIIEMYSYVLKKLASGALGGKVPLEVHFAPDGHHAYKQLIESRFNLVMTDLYMPVMDGFALVEKIRHDENLKSIPVIAISAGGKEAQDRALGLGVDIYLRKPVKFVEVLETVKQLLRIK